jgi:exportin-2 (importin alpha re-exporter)
MELTSFGRLDLQVQPILGVFQKLISSKANDQHGFALLTGIVRGIPLEAVTPYLGTIFQLLFQRLSSLKTHKFVRGFVVFMSTFVCIHGAAQLLEVLNTVQPNIVVMLLDQVWLPGLSGLHAAPERKIASVALTKLVCDCPAMRDPAHLAVWNKALSHVVPLLEATGVEAVEDDDNFGTPSCVPRADSALYEVAIP